MIDVGTVIKFDAKDKYIYIIKQCYRGEYLFSCLSPDIIHQGYGFGAEHWTIYTDIFREDE